jgi:AraC-like DNA-binding protein
MGESAMVVCTFAMPPGVVFDWHTHDDHQLAWAASGVLSVRSETTAWVLPPTRALFIPAGVRHETISEGMATMRAAYMNPVAFAINWTDCTPVTVTSLMAELIDFLESVSLSADQRTNAESLLVDLLRPVATTSIDVTMPTEERARRVAEAIQCDPADARPLSAWGHVVGASDRTLARLFLSETGLSFGRWRTRLRMRTAMNALASGDSVGNVAHEVGYASSSAFVSAFRRETGITPNAYFRKPSVSDV